LPQGYDALAVNILDTYARISDGNVSGGLTNPRSSGIWREFDNNAGIDK